jgi:hypothetical protein
LEDVVEYSIYWEGSIFLFEVLQAVWGAARHSAHIQEVSEEDGVDDVAVAPTQLLLPCEKVLICTSASFHRPATEY